MTTEPAHAIYAPSSAHRWAGEGVHGCTASATAIAALGEQESGEEALEGTAAHEELERVLGGAEPDTEHPAAYGIALAVDYVRQLPPGRMWVEQRVKLTEKIWGRCDVGHWHDESSTLTILDLKNGYVNVEAERNAQLRCYAAGSIYTHKLPAKWIRYVVVQPNSFLPVPRVKQWVESADDLFRFAERVAAIPDGPLTFTAGEQCTYCPMFGRCPASRDVLIRLGTALANAPDAIPPGQVALFMAMEKPIADWFKAVDKAQTKKALAGNMPPGMKLVATQKHRAWKDSAAARARVIEKFGIDVLEPPTPAQAEKLGLDKTWVDANSEKPEGGPALAFDSDRRAPWAPKSVENMFAAVTNKSGTDMVPVVRG